MWMNRPGPRCLAFLVALMVTHSASANEPLVPTVPVEEASPRYQKKLQQVLDGYTISEALPPHDLEARQDTFEYLLGDLPLSSRIVRELELGRYDITRIGQDAIDIDDGEGALVRLRPVVHKPGHIVYYGRGRLKASNLPEVTGDGIVVIVWRTEPDGAFLVRARIWFRLDDRFLHLVTQVFKKTLGEVAGGRAGAVVETAVTVTEAVQEDPERVYQAMVASQRFTNEELEQFQARFLTE